MELLWFYDAYTHNTYAENRITNTIQQPTVMLGLKRSSKTAKAGRSPDPTSEVMSLNSREFSLYVCTKQI